MPSTRNTLNICAIIAVRNEFHYLSVLLPHLAAQDIDVVIIDNESTDASHELYARFMGAPVIRVDTLPYRGFFSLSDQLAAKQRVSREIGHDWVIHHDADEILEHRLPGKSLRDAIHEADQSGYNVINFDEFVFLPEPDSDYSGKNYFTGILRYYFFEPMPNRLNRAWKRTSQFIHGASGGHRLEGSGLSISPIHHILRHYIVLSEEHARKKYLKRSFDHTDLSRGWHGNRLDFTRENLLLPADVEAIQHLKSFDSRDFSRRHPADKHFWQW